MKIDIIQTYIFIHMIYLLYVFGRANVFLMKHNKNKEETNTGIDGIDIVFIILTLIFPMFVHGVINEINKHK